ncbi:MAG: hypothetical protein F6J97_16350 [Leptolyngbya sp. SIO4C1]|nr:hypothetical protein [Leptolyngbya sp. SIO4C1]
MAEHPKGSKEIKQLFTVKPKPKPGERLWGSKLLYELVLVRPWVLVGGFWLLLLLTSAIAIGGLTSPGKQLAETVPSEPAPASVSDATVTSRLPAADASAVDPAATLDAAKRAMPIWPLWALVVACAGGCLVMSRPGQPASLRRARSRRRLSPAARAATLKRQQLSQRRAQLRQQHPQIKPQYPSAQVMSIQASGAIQQVSPSPAPRPKVVSFDVKQPVVTVLPAEETHPLDWQDGSLAHKLDVRRKRSLNSFL